MEFQENLLNQDSSCGRMYQELLAQTRVRTSDKSSAELYRLSKNNLMFLNLQTRDQEQNGEEQEPYWEMVGVSLGDNLMLNIGEFPKDEDVSTLSQILEDTVPQKYCLSVKACQGIIKRAELRGKKLPEILEKALNNVITMDVYQEKQKKQNT